MADEVKLFGVHESPFSRRIEMALKLKGVEYEYIEVDLYNKSPLFLQYNPIHQKVPVLVHNGKPIAESVIILEYIDETWKHNPILPKDPYQRAMARFWASLINEKLVPVIRKARLSLGTEREEAIEEACGYLKVLENEVKGKRFFGGDTIGLVDIVATFIAHWVMILQEAVGIEVITIDKFPALCKWVEELVNSHVIKDNLPHKPRLHAYYKSHCATPPPATE